ncbi:MAG: Spore germination protein A3 precursor [Firmicutes bacterium ADurb.Bin182]|nr:MAG: Spore germination protein A3 precursor [Firmicutes bacterium ADurb.Bin182]
MQKKHIKSFFLCLIAALFLTGCWDEQNINDLDIITMVIFDKKDEEYHFYVEVATIQTARQEQGNAQVPMSTFVHARGKTITEARENIDRQLDRPIYLATVRTLIITERAAKNDLEEYLYRLRADPSYRQKLLLITTRDEPEELIKTEPDNNMLVGFSFDDTLRSTIDEGQAIKITLNHCFQSLLSKDPFLLPCMGLFEDHIILRGYSVISENKCSGIIPVELSKPIVYMLGKNPFWHYRVPLEDKTVTIRAELQRKKIKPKYAQGKISFVMKFDFKAIVEYFDIMDKKPLDKATEEAIKEKFKKILEDEFKNTIVLSQKSYEIDYLGFGDEFKMHYPDEFESMDWDKEYPKSSITMDFSIDLTTEEHIDFDPS